MREGGKAGTVSWRWVTKTYFILNTQEGRWKKLRVRVHCEHICISPVNTINSWHTNPLAWCKTKDAYRSAWSLVVRNPAALLGHKSYAVFVFSLSKVFIIVAVFIRKCIPIQDYALRVHELMKFSCCCFSTFLWINEFLTHIVAQYNVYYLKLPAVRFDATRHSHFACWLARTAQY